MRIESKCIEVKTSGNNEREETCEERNRLVGPCVSPVLECYRSNLRKHCPLLERDFEFCFEKMQIIISTPREIERQKGEAGNETDLQRNK